MLSTFYNDLENGGLGVDDLWRGFCNVFQQHTPVSLHGACKNKKHAQDLQHQLKKQPGKCSSINGLALSGKKLHFTKCICLTVGQMQTWKYIHPISTSAKYKRKASG